MPQDDEIINQFAIKSKRLSTNSGGCGLQMF
jgi:hypothetical protein